MSNSIRLSQYPDPLRLINSSSSWVARYLSFLSSHTKQNFLSISSHSEVDNRQHSVVKTQTKALAAVANEGPREDLDLSAVSIELIPICSEDQFNQMIEEAQKLGQPVIVVWMASWCRKCIYLKPKLEKLAARCQPRLKFYCVNVNKVPQKLIDRAGVNKMPTIQLWEDGNKQAEVIGGHKAHFVIDDVCEMIGGV